MGQEDDNNNIIDLEDGIDGTLPIDATREEAIAYARENPNKIFLDKSFSAWGNKFFSQGKGKKGRAKDVRSLVEFVNECMTPLEEEE